MLLLLYSITYRADSMILDRKPSHHHCFGDSSSRQSSEQKANEGVMDNLRSSPGVGNCSGGTILLDIDGSSILSSCSIYSLCLSDFRSFVLRIRIVSSSPTSLVAPMEMRD